MKNKFAIILFLIASTSSFSFESNNKKSFLDNINFFSTEKRMFVENGISLENGGDFIPNTIGMDFLFCLNMKEFICMAGIENSQEGFNFATQLVYWPSYKNIFNLGVGSIFHVYNKRDEFNEINFLPGIFCKYKIGNNFFIMANFLYLLKSSYFYCLGLDSFNLINNNIAFSIKASYKIKNLMNVYTELSSYTLYRYMLYFAPLFKMGLNFTLIDNVNFGTEIEFQYIDMFTLSANCNSVNLRAFLRIFI